MMGYANQLLPLCLSQQKLREKLYAKVDGERVNLFAIPLESIYIMDITHILMALLLITSNWVDVPLIAYPKALKNTQKGFIKKITRCPCEYWGVNYGLSGIDQQLAIEKRGFKLSTISRIEDVLGYKIDKAKIGMYPRELFVMPNARSVSSDRE